jgi:hypothetical protein
MDKHTRQIVTDMIQWISDGISGRDVMVEAADCFKCSSQRSERGSPSSREAEVSR